MKHLLLGLLIAALGGIGGCDVIGQRHRSDAEMMRTFNEHRAQFEELIQMIQYDAGLRRVDDSWTDPADPTTVGVSPERIALYRSKMNAIGIARGFAAYGGPDSVEFLASAQGLVTGGSMKGYAFARVPPKPIVVDLDLVAKMGRGTKISPTYRRIDEQWYLVYEQN
jgi:hypothetical protein